MATINKTFRGSVAATGADPMDRIIVTAVVAVTDAIQTVLAADSASYSTTVTVVSAKFTRASNGVVVSDYTGAITATCTFGPIVPGAPDSGRLCSVAVTAMGTGLFTGSAHCTLFDGIVETVDVITPVAPSVTPDGLLGSYFTNQDLSGIPEATRVDTAVNFNPFTGASIPAGVDETYFSAQWTGEIQAPATGAFQFRLTHDNGSRLYLDSVLHINQWNTEGVVVAATPSLSWTSGDKHTVRLDLENHGGTSVVKLEWKYPGQDWQVVPTAYMYSGSVDAPDLPPPPASRERSQVYIETINRYPEA